MHKHQPIFQSQNGKKSELCQSEKCTLTIVGFKIVILYIKLSVFIVQLFTGNLSQMLRSTYFQFLAILLIYYLQETFVFQYQNSLFALTETIDLNVLECNFIFIFFVSFSCYV